MDLDLSGSNLAATTRDEKVPTCLPDSTVVSYNAVFDHRSHQPVFTLLCISVDFVMSNHIDYY